MMHPRKIELLRNQSRIVIYTFFDKFETFFEQIGHTVQGSLHGQRPKGRPVTVNFYE